jgi:hypothetical protein
LATNKNFPAGSIAIPIGLLPVLAAAALAELRVPSELIVYAETVPDALLSTNKAFNEGVSAIAKGMLPVASRFPAGLTAPELNDAE